MGSETIVVRRQSRCARSAALLPALMLSGAGWAAGPELPAGGQVVAGVAQIGAADGGQLRIDQASARAVIDWSSFSIGAGGRVHFANGQGATLNRVLGGDPSTIAGQLSATGSLYLLNPAGVLVGPEGRVLTGGGFVASTRDVAPAAFMAGAMTLEGQSAAGVVNAGSIEAGGDAVLIGHVVDNRGSIRAGGRASLLAADRVVLRAVDGDARIHVEHVAGGTGDVTTAGRIEAAAAELQAVGGNVYALAADTGGLVRATGAVTEGGRIRLVGGQGVTVSGTLDASGAAGGAIEVTAPGVLVSGTARIAASGASGDGGSIKIGGERMGAPGLAAADRLLVESGAEIDAGSVAARGGEVILWSEQWTRFEGLIRADGPLGGGFVETSSKGALAIDEGRVEVGRGLWLLDPRNVNIGIGGFNPGGPYPNPFVIDPPNGPGVYNVSRNGIQSALNAGSNVIVTTNQPLGTDPGNITVASTISWSGAGSLTLLADNDILVNASITSSGAGSLTLDAANRVQVNAVLTASGSGNITLIGRGAGVDFIGSGNRIWQTNGGNFTISAPGPTGDIIFGRTASNGNWQLYAGGGALTLNAGRNIQLGRPLSNPGWVRVGRDTDTGPVTVTAGNQFSLLASPVSGVFAELRAGGPMTITAPTVLIQSTAEAPALLRAVGSQLTINATTGTFNGPLQSTANTLLSGGAYSFSVSPTLTLAANNSFTLAAGASISATVGLAIQTAGTGDIILNGPVSGVTLTADSADEMVIGAAINMSGAGNAIVLHGGRRIVNNAGVSPLNAPNGRWLTYSVSPFDDIGWELLNPDAPNLYGRSFGFFPPVSAPGTGNRRIYSFTPVLTYTAGSGSKTYGGANPSLGVTVSGLVPGDNLADAVIGTPTVTSTGFALAAPVGSYATVPGGVTATEQGYALAFVNGVLTVNPAPLTVTADSLSKIYGDPDPALTFAVSGLVLGETPGAVLTGALARAPGETVAGGPYAITQGTLSASSNYSLTFVPGTFTITPAPLTVVANAQSKVYGDPDPALTFAASGFRLGDTAASVLTGALARAPGETVAGGPYAITQGTLSANANYALAFTGSFLTITPALLSIVANPAAKTYGDPDPVFTFTASGFRFTDDSSILTGALARVAGETVGSYAITQGTLAANSNYTIGFTGSLLTINPALLTVTANNISRTYGDPDPALTFAASGFRLGDDASVLTGALARAAGENVGSYAITQGTLAATNYTIDFVPGTFTITRALLSIVANAQSKVYGDPDPALTFAASGFRLSDDASILTGALARAPGETVAGGPYAITQGTLGAGGNYDIAFTGASLSITPAPLLITPDSLSKAFGAPDPVFTFTASGFRLGDTAATALTGALSRQPGEAVGDYAILPGTLASTGNYVLSFAPATFSIVARLLQVAANNAVKTYGQPDPVFTFTASGFAPGDDISIITGSLSRVPGETVGSYAITQGTLAATGYTIQFTPGVLTIDPALLTVIALNQSREYGLPDPVLTFTASGFQFGEDESILTGALARAPGETVGSYAITQGTLSAGANYVIGFTGAAFTITPALLTVVANALSKVYGDADPALTFAASGFRLGDTAASVLTGALARAPGETVAGGPYAITQGTLSANANYTLAFTGSFLTITPATLSVAALASGKIYGDPDPLLGFTATGFRLGDTIASLSGSLARSPGENVGSYAITRGTLGNPNYIIDFTGATFTISPALLRIIAAAQTREYGLPDPALTFAASGFRFNDTAASVLTGALARVPGEDVGTYAITQGTLAATANYTIDFTGANLAITPAPLDVVANPQTKVYGNPDPVLTFAASGFRRGDTAASVLSGALSRAPGETVAGGPYAIVQGTLVSNPNYAIRFTGAGLTITPRPLSVALVGTVGRVYDATTLAPLSAGNIQLSGVLPGDAVGVAVGDARYDNPNVGTGKLVTATGLTLTGTAAGNYSVAGTASAAIGTITPAPLTAVALDAERPFGLPNPPFQLQLTGLRGNDTAASIGLSATSSATPQSPPGLYAIEVVGNPLNYAVTRIPGTLTVLPALAFARSAPEPVTVPALGGLVQQGVATGVHALNDTLDLAAGLLPAPDPVLRSTRYTIRVEPSPPPPGGLGGSSVFDAGAIRP